MFGGFFTDAWGTFIDYGDTWTFDGTRWARRLPLLAPTPRDSPAVAFDSRRGRTVLFGGAGPDVVPMGDTWEWTGTEWIPRPGTPPARVGGAMAFDAIRGQSVLVGGYGATAPRTDAWTWDGETWTLLPGATPAPAASTNGSQYLGAMAYDEARGRLVVFSQLDDRIWELTEAGRAASLIVRLPVYDPGTSPSSLTVTAWAAATVTSQASLYSSLELSLWDSARARWVRVASMATGATGPLTATVSGGDIGRFTSTGSLFVLAAAPPSSTTSESTLSVDYLQAELEW